MGSAPLCKQAGQLLQQQLQHTHTHTSAQARWSKLGGRGEEAWPGPAQAGGQATSRSQPVRGMLFRASTGAVAPRMHQSRQLQGPEFPRASTRFSQFSRAFRPTRPRIHSHLPIPQLAPTPQLPPLHRGRLNTTMREFACPVPPPRCHPALETPSDPLEKPLPCLKRPPRRKPRSRGRPPRRAAAPMAR